MRTFVARLVDLREGEGRPLFQAFSSLFGLIAGHTILETARDALFLTKLPANRLTLVYVLLAGLTLVGSALNKRIVRAIGRRNAFISSLASPSSSRSRSPRASCGARACSSRPSCSRRCSSSGPGASSRWAAPARWSWS